MKVASNPINIQMSSLKQMLVFLRGEGKDAFLRFSVVKEDAENGDCRLKQVRDKWPERQAGQVVRDPKNTVGQHPGTVLFAAFLHDAHHKRQTGKQGKHVSEFRKG